MIWQALYPIIISFGFVLIQVVRKKETWQTGLPFAICPIANLSFRPLQFGLRSLALVDNVIVWLTILGCMIAIWPHYRWVAGAQLPCLIWVSIATPLQTSISLTH